MKNLLDKVNEYYNLKKAETDEVVKSNLACGYININESSHDNVIMTLSYIYGYICGIYGEDEDLQKEYELFMDEYILATDLNTIVEFKYDVRKYTMNQEIYNKAFEKGKKLRKFKKMIVPVANIMRSNILSFNEKENTIKGISSIVYDDNISDIGFADIVSIRNNKNYNDLYVAMIKNNKNNLISSMLRDPKCEIYAEAIYRYEHIFEISYPLKEYITDKSNEKINEVIGKLVKTSGPFIYKNTDKLNILKLMMKYVKKAVIEEERRKYFNDLSMYYENLMAINNISTIYEYEDDGKKFTR